MIMAEYVDEDASTAVAVGREMRESAAVAVVRASATAWFEFLLDSSLLEKHLNKPDSDLTAPELISLFLYQADITLATQREIENKEFGFISGSSTAQSDTALDEKPNLVANYKVQTLRLLAIKTACHLKWNLEFLQLNLPLAILKSLLLELLKVVTGFDNISSKTFTEDDLQNADPEVLFAVVLYHRWCLTSLLRESFPTKPLKTPNVQVPGLLDPSISSANLKDSIIKSLRENVDNSVTFLENFLTLGKSTRMPVMSCFGMSKTDSSPNKIANDWSSGIMIDKIEMNCQISYDLGCHFFLIRNYEKANSSFGNCKEFIDKIQSPVFSNIDVKSLDGYLCACAGVLVIPLNQCSPPSLYERVQMSIRNNFQGLTALLIEDLTKQELSFAYRASLAESTHSVQRQDSLYEEVLVCNSIRRSLDGRVVMFDLVMTLNRTLGLVDFYIKVCVDIHKVLSEIQRDNLKFSLRYLCQVISPETHFVNLLLSSELHCLFDEEVQQSLLDHTKSAAASPPFCFTFNLPQPAEENMKVAELERELLVTYEPTVIKELVQKLIGRIGKYQTVFLSEKWKIPRDLHHLIETLPIPQPVTPIFVHILVAKARICITLKHFEKAREMLNLADSTIRDISLKLSKLLRWEVLLVDLLQLFDAPQFIYNGNFQDLVKRVKTCISTFQHFDHESLPCPDLLCACVAFLLNTQDFDSLSGMNNGNINGYVQFGRMVAALSKEIPALKTARTSAREFIDAVRLTFTNTVQMKRSSSGAATAAMRDTHTALLSPDGLIMLMKMIKEPAVLSLFVSCLTKLFNLMKDDISEEIYSDYITLWPTALSSSNTVLNESALSAAVESLMKHALSMNPSQPSWLRTQADLSYAKGDYFSSLRHYLLLGVVSTDFFTEPITKNVYDDQVYRRMIRCCSSMNCQTQVAILCQFLDETDYTVAFKALQERSSDDAMDAYYDCIWDSTILEFLIYLHNKRGEVEKRKLVLQLIGQMELNSNNRVEISMEAAKLRKGRFMRAMAKQYLATNVS